MCVCVCLYIYKKARVLGEIISFPLGAMSLLDVFPTQRISNGEDLKTLKQISNLKIFLACHCATFIPHLPPHQAIVSFNQDVESSNLLVQNIYRNLFESQQTKEESPFSWNRMDRALRRPIQTDRRYTDPRTSFRWKNIFLTKRYFTFGVRTTAEDEVHIVQTTAAPLAYYESSSPNLKERSFKVSDRMKYKKYILRPFQNYVVPPKTQYLIVTTQKSLFLVDRCSYSLWKQLKEEISFQSPMMFQEKEEENPPPPLPIPSLDDKRSWTKPLFPETKSTRQRNEIEVITIEDEEEEKKLPLKKRSTYRNLPGVQDPLQNPEASSSSSPTCSNRQPLSDSSQTEPLPVSSSSSSSSSPPTCPDIVEVECQTGPQASKSPDIVEVECQPGPQVPTGPEIMEAESQPGSQVPTGPEIMEVEFQPGKQVPTGPEIMEVESQPGPDILDPSTHPKETPSVSRQPCEDPALPVWNDYMDLQNLVQQEGEENNHTDGWVKDCLDHLTSNEIELLWNCISEITSEMG